MQIEQGQNRQAESPAGGLLPGREVVDQQAPGYRHRDPRHINEIQHAYMKVLFKEQPES